MAIDLAELIDKLPPLKIPGLHSTETIGVDLGTTSIKVVQLKGAPGKMSLVRWSVIPLSQTGEGGDKAELSPEERKAQAISALKNYRGTGKGFPKNAATSVSGNAVIVRYVKFPKLTRKELSKTIKAEAEPYIPFNVEEVHIGFHPLMDVVDEGKQKMETVLVAAKKDFIAQRVEILEGAGFKPAVIDVDAFCLESLYDAMQDPPSAGVPAPQENVLIANIGFSKTNFVIIENGVSMVVKDSPVAGLVISKALTKSLGVDSKAAEKLKLTGGILTPEEKEMAPKEAQAVSDACLNAARDIATEIRKIIQYYVTQGKEKKIQRVLLAGGSANIRNLTQFMSGELNLQVERLNPFIKVAGAANVPEEYQPVLAIAAGLALRKPGDIKES